MRTYQRGRSRKRKVSMSKKFRDMTRRGLAFLMCLGIILTGMPTVSAFADEAGTVITLDDDGKYFTEEDTEFYDRDHGCEEDSEEDCDGGSFSDEETADPGEDLNEENEEIEEDTEEDRENRDEEDTEHDENEDTEYGDEDTGPEEDEETEDEDETGEDAAVDEEEEKAAGSVPSVPSAYSAASYETVSAKIYTDETYEEILADKTTIELSGKMPEGAVAKAYPVEVEIDGITVLAAYDISIFDVDGEEYEPDEDDFIEVTIENEEIREALEEEAELTVFHMDEVDEEPEEIVRLPRKTKKARFRAKHFSIYIVGADDELYELDGKTPHYVYILNFYLGDVEDPDDENGYYLLSTQTVSAGEKAEEPAVPDQDGYEFAGWYTDPGGKGKKYDFYNDTMPEIEDEQDHKIDLYAHYTEAYVVHYMTHEHKEGDESTRVIFHTEEYAFNAPLYTKDAEDFYLKEGYLSVPDPITGILITSLAVTGWLDENGDEWKTGYPVTGSLNLYPVVEPACWIYFDMNGHDSIENPAPEYVLASETYIGTLPEPEVAGYSFGGWYTQAEDGELVTADSELDDIPKNADGSITLYAHWKEAKAAYTINIWRQKAIDGAAGVNSKEIKDGETYDDYIQYYDYAESHYVTAEQSQLYTGDIPTTSAVDNWNIYTGYGTTTNENSAYYGFEYGANTTARTRTLNNLNDITMEADGSTIINIFYNRVTVTWTFQKNGQYGVNGTLIGLYDTNVAPADGAGAGTLSDWPSAGGNHIWECVISSSQTKPYTFEAKFKILHDAVSLTFRPYSFSNANKPVYYYLEVTNEAAQVDPYGDKAAEAAGYGISYTKTVAGKPYVFTRVLYVQNRLEIESKFVGYEYAGYNVTDNGTKFTGTGSSIPTNADKCFIFNDAIATHTITLISSDRVVGVDATGNAVTTAQKVTYPDGNRTSVKYGTDMKEYPFPEELDGDTWGPAYYYHFTGWYEDPSLTSPFSITTMPNNNVVAYADWALNDITVTFATGTSDVEAPTAQEIKATGKAIDPGILDRDGYTHVGWVDQNGKIFNFDTVLYKDTVLTAIWKSDDESGFTMLYDLNIDNSYGLLDGYEGITYADNPEHFAVDEELWTIEHAFPDLAKDAAGMFIGWNTAADGTGKMYYPDDIFTLEDVEVSNEGTVTLYAVWAYRNESTLVLLHNYPDGYVLQTGETEQDVLTDDNLTSVNLVSVSGLEYHHEITVEDPDGTVHTYRFDGWSTTYPGDDPTDDDVDINADETVAADTLYTSADTRTNYLFAVWLEVHNITVTKEVVNNAVNYEIPGDQTFTFNWTFTDGEGNEIANEDPVTIRDGEYFIIPGVASGESVTITEEQADGFKTSYNGAHVDVRDDGVGKYTFTMEDDSTEITVTNTLITYWTVEKELINENEGNGKDGMFAAGDTAQFRITVTDISDAKIGKIDVAEMLDGAVFKESEDGTYTLNDEKTVATIEDLAAGDSVLLYAEYTIEEKDIGKQLSNGVTTSGGDPDDEKPGPDGEANIPTEDANPHLSVAKTADVEDGYKAALGDMIVYTIKVINDGNVTITDISVEDDLTGLKETIESLAPGESRTYTTTYTVTEKDIEAGSIVNTAVATGTGPDGFPEDTEGIGESTVETEIPDEGGNDPGDEDYPEAEEDPDSGSGSDSDGSGSSGSGSGGSGSSSHGSSSYTGNVRNVNTGKTGHWILEGGYLTLADGSHPSNEYLDVDGEIWAFYTYGYAVAKKHTQYYTDEAIEAAGYIPEVTGTWETIGWWFEYDDGTYPHDEWALLEYNGLTYWYHFDIDGWMDDGWFTGNGNTYYLDPVYDGWRGHMMTGWQLIGGYWYYFSEDKNTLGVLLKDSLTPDGFKVDENGRWIGE